MRKIRRNPNDDYKTSEKVGRKKFSEKKEKKTRQTATTRIRRNKTLVTRCKKVITGSVINEALKVLPIRNIWCPDGTGAEA